MNRLILALILVLNVTGTAAVAQDLAALARVLPQGTTLRDRGDGVELRLRLSQAVPYRVFTLDQPKRLILDFNEVDWSGFDPATFGQSARITDLRVGVVRPGLSRMVLDLGAALAVKTAGLSAPPGQPATVLLQLAATSDAEYAANAGAPADAFAQPAPTSPAVTHPRQTGERPLVVVLDPGHGGIDPGAERDGVIEAELILTFARELKEILLRTGDFKVELTREGDVFVPLEARVSFARQAGADVFVSLHADALVVGRATGSTVYTLSDTATDVASQKLAERHDRGDLLAGVDLRNQDDVIAKVLMDMARTETAPRSDKLATALVDGLRATVGVRKRPHLAAGFSVLKAPDIPSVLLELGFLSSPRDLKRLRDPEWRQSAAIGIRNALQAWARQDAADALLLRK
jgi:N-acetylmuramoyl-L-alanine amidase